MFTSFKTIALCALAIALAACDSASEKEQEVVEKTPPPPAETVEGQDLISDADREYIWQIEHRVNLVKEHGFSRLGKAIASRDAAALQGVFPRDFSGSVPAPGAGSRYDAKGFSVQATSLEDGAAELTLDRGKFVRWFLDRVGALGDGELKVRTHVITLSPLDRDKLDGGWTGTGKIEVASKSADGALGELVLYFGLALDQISEERFGKPGWLSEIAVTRTRDGSADQSLMVDATEQFGLPRNFLWDNWKVPRQQRLINTGGVYLNDFNKDGLHDMFVTDLKVSFFLIGEAGGKFREATDELDIRGHLGGGFAAFIDIDGDGWEDLIHGIAQHPDGFRVYQNLKGQFFKDVTEKSNLPGFLLGMSIEEARAMMEKKQPAKTQQKPTGLSLADYDLDGKVDLYVTRGAAGSFKSGSWIDGKAGKLANNQLLRNLGDWQFEDVTNGAPLNGGQRSTSNAVWLHADDDLRPDLYVIDEFGDGILLANNADGSFESIALNERPTDFGSMGMTAGDIDNDGHTDIYIAEMYSKAGERVMANVPPGTYDAEVTRKLERLVDGSQLYLGGGGRKFDPVGIKMGVNAVGWAWGASLADLNNDGWLDLYATAGFISQERGKPDG